MLALVHSAPITLERYRTPNLGVLSSPRRWYRDVDGWPWAADNDAYSKWDAGRYRAMLDGIRDLPGCLFVTAPDVVEDALATLASFYFWLPILVPLPIAFALQDGIESRDVPWDNVSALFIGGSTGWKVGIEAARLAAEARERGVWVHMGRVNGHRRIRYANSIGVDSFDGSSLGWFKTRYLRQYAHHANQGPQGRLDSIGPGVASASRQS